MNYYLNENKNQFDNFLSNKRATLYFVFFWANFYSFNDIYYFVSCVVLIKEDTFLLDNRLGDVVSPALVQTFSFRAIEDRDNSNLIL